MGLYDPDREDTTTYNVVMNHEEQYSIWPVGRELPLGWSAVGKSGPKAECLEYIKQVWTDMRPLSLRKKMAQAEQDAAMHPVPVEEPQPPEAEEGDLVDRLCTGRHPVEITLRPESTVEAFKASIDRGYVHVKFTDTKGGTELGVRLIREETQTEQADFARGTGNVHLEGSLNLNYRDVRCFADINLPALTGQGYLVAV
jgi:uncharacterized protein YbdZ (MbtH family)